MLQAAVASFLVVHGLITAAIGVGSLAGGPGAANPAWLSWWPTALGRSWLLDALPLGAGAARLGGALWIVAGLGLIAAGLGLFGTPLLHAGWPALALAGAALGLAALVLYFHPFYVLAVLLNAAILVGVLGLLRPGSGAAPV
jgi:hypothetical protein